MTRSVSLAYGRSPLTVTVPGGATVLAAPPGPAATRPLPELLADALAHPVGAARLRGRVPAGAPVTLIVSDATRDEPRAELIAAVRAEVGEDVRWTLAIANGTHRPGGTAGLGLPGDLPVVDHDGADDGAFDDAGVTRRGTRVRFPRWLRASALAVATGRIRPHYFAGWGAGLKAVFPGLGHRDDIRANHRLKADPSARLGRADGNACRDDMEEAARLLGVDTFLLDVLCDAEDRPFGAVSGDPVAAFRAGAERCRPACEVAAPRADVVVVSERLPLSGSLYQASKLLAPAAACLRPGGTVILAAECPDGTGPLSIVNDGIYALGLRPLFAGAHTIYLVSSLSEEQVAATYCRYAPNVEWALARSRGDVLVLPSAGNLIPRVAP